MKICVALSTYEGERYVQSAIESVLQQRFTSLQLHIIDDASEDGTWDTIKEFDDERIVATRNERRRGLFANLNTIIGRSEAPLIKLLGQDDILFENCLSEGWKFFQRHREVGYFYSNNDSIDDLGNVVAPPLEDEKSPILFSREVADMFSFTYGCLSANISNLFVPRNVLERVRGFREDTISADFDLLVRIQEMYRVGRINRSLLHVRDHEAQWSRGLNGVADGIKTGVELHVILKDRIERVHKTVKREQMKALLRRKMSQTYFDNMMRLVVGGRWRDAMVSAKALNRAVPISHLVLFWIASLPKRVLRAMSKRGSAHL